MSRELALTDRAALALLDDAERALAEVSTPEDADELWRKVRAVEEAARLARLADATVGAMVRVRLRAKRRWGELLPVVDHGGDRRSDQVTPRNLKPDERVAESRARKLAAVPSEAFEAALESTDPDKPPSEASLLRAASSQGQQRHADDEPASAKPVAKVTAYFSDDERQRKAEDDLPLEEALSAVTPERAQAWLKALRDRRKRTAKLIERVEAATGQRTGRELGLVDEIERQVAYLPKQREAVRKLDLDAGERIAGPERAEAWRLQFRGSSLLMAELAFAGGDEPEGDELAEIEAFAERAGVELEGTER